MSMKKTLRGDPQPVQRVANRSLAKGLGWGLIAGLTGTLVMDIVLMGTLSVAGLPPLTCFSIVGNTVARFFSILGVEMAGGVPLGVATHYLVGPAFGVIFGALVTRVDALRIDTLKKGILLAVLYVEILSQPILASTPILLKMTAAGTLQWYAGSFVMHLLLALVLGAIVSCGLRGSAAMNRRSSQAKPGSNFSPEPGK
jgi:hypothetical protein